MDQMILGPGIFSRVSYTDTRSGNIGLRSLWTPVNELPCYRLCTYPFHLLPLFGHWPIIVGIRLSCILQAKQNRRRYKYHLFICHLKWAWTYAWNVRSVVWCYQGFRFLFLSHLPQHMVSAYKVTSRLKIDAGASAIIYELHILKKKGKTEHSQVNLFSSRTHIMLQHTG